MLNNGLDTCFYLTSTVKSANQDETLYGQPPSLTLSFMNINAKLHPLWTIIIVKRSRLYIEQENTCQVHFCIVGSNLIIFQ